jgi:hypothetical protein
LRGYLSTFDDIYVPNSEFVNANLSRSSIKAPEAKYLNQISNLVMVHWQRDAGMRRNQFLFFSFLPTFLEAENSGLVKTTPCKKFTDAHSRNTNDLRQNTMASYEYKSKHRHINIQYKGITYTQSNGIILKYTKAPQAHKVQRHHENT